MGWAILLFYVTLHVNRNRCFRRFQHQALIEVKILEELRRRDADEEYNTIHMITHFRFRNHLCIVFELMGSVNWVGSTTEYISNSGLD